jgi:hypothetical protein
MLPHLSPCEAARLGERVPAAPPTPAAWSAAPGRRMWLDSQPLGVDQGGNARWLVRVRFVDARGDETSLLHGGDIEFAASRGVVQWQTRARFGAPAAIVATNASGPLAVKAVALDPPGIAEARAATDTRRWSMPRVVAAPLGAHLVQVGWFPQESSARVVVRRSGREGTYTVCSLAPPSSSCTDPNVLPGSSYRYRVIRVGSATVSLRVRTPPELPPQSLATLRGKGVWLSFSPDPRDDDSYVSLDAAAIADRAARAGLSYIELRFAYGPFWEITRAAKPAVDALIDAAAAHGVAVIGWTVPRSLSFEDLSGSVAAASYRTPRGTRVSGVALDLERGGDFMGEGTQAYAALKQYPRMLRAALGPRAAIVATVEDPYFERLSNRDVPYPDIARSVDALQPMAYWRLFPTREAGAAATRRAFAASFRTLRHLVKRAVPISMGGQTSPLGACGAPPPDEIGASLAESRALGALGEAFFDYHGAAQAKWDAIASFTW